MASFSLSLLPIPSLRCPPSLSISHRLTFPCSISLSLSTVYPFPSSLWPSSLTLRRSSSPHAILYISHTRLKFLSHGFQATLNKENSGRERRRGGKEEEETPALKTQRQEMKISSFTFQVMRYSCKMQLVIRWAIVYDTLLNLLLDLLLDLYQCGSSNTCRGISPGKTWDLNYPSFALSIQDGQPISGTFKRTVTNVGLANSTYHVNVHIPSSVKMSSPLPLRRSLWRRL